MNDFTDSELKDAEGEPLTTGELALIVGIFALCIGSSVFLVYWAFRAWLPVLLTWINA